jgi:hypothetical protein
MPETPNPTDDLRVLQQIARRVEKLSDPSKVWLRDRLNADLAASDDGAVVPFESGGTGS